MRRRLPDWTERLAACFEDAACIPFELGVHDCGLFAIAAAEAITGRVPAPWLRAASYGTEDELVRVLAPYDGLEGAAVASMAAFGATEIAPAFAQRGDWVLLDVGNELLLGVAAGDAAMAPGVEGLRAVPLRRCARRAWAF